jgi:uncharacterized protein (TIGR02266 family)
MREKTRDRAFPRVPVRLAVHYRTDGELRSSLIQSLSAGGVFIRTSRPLAIGTPLTMEIHIDADPTAQPICIEGKVVWERLIGQDNLPDGMGVEFTEAPPEPLRKFLTAEVA